MTRGRPGDRSVTAFAPGSIGNLGSGFDVLGMALAGPGDTVTVRRAEAPGIAVTVLSDPHERIPSDPDRNSAAVAARSLLAPWEDFAGVGLALELRKGLPLSAGMGGSAASAVAAAVAVDALFNLGSTPLELLGAALAGEEAAAGAPHPDNAAPSLRGGVVLVRGVAQDMEMVSIPVPEGLAVALVHPHVQFSTREGRALLPECLALPTAVRQWGNVATLLSGLHAGDLDLVGKGLEDVVAEPVRGPRIPGFREVQEAARGAGALGCTISGSGPSLFALCESEGVAQVVGEAMGEAFRSVGGVASDVFVGTADAPGAMVTERVD